MLSMLALPLVALACQAVMAVGLANAWRRGTGGLATRTALTALLPFGAAFALFLNEWNLLGYRL